MLDLIILIVFIVSLFFGSSGINWGITVIFLASIIIKVCKKCKKAEDK